MWDTLWLCRIATMAGPQPYGLIEDGAIATHGETIAWAGERTALPDVPDACAHEIVALPGKLLTPGLIDAHTHLVYGGNRAGEFAMRLAGKTFAEIAQAGGGILSTVAATRAATEQQLYDAAAQRIAAMSAGGVTTVEIKSGYGLDRDTELRMLRVARRLAGRVPIDVRTTFLGAHALPREYAGRRDDYVALVCEVLRAGAAEGLIDAVDGFCEHIAFSADEIRRIFDVARELGIPVKLHGAQLTENAGPQLAAEFDALSVDHGERLTTDDVAALRRAGSVVVVLPTASYFIADERRPPVERFRETGLPIAVATDCNPGTSPLTSLLVALNMACIRFGLTCEEALAGATRHAARALGLGERIGTLEKGKIADFALWDAEHPAELPYSFGATRCLGVVKRGRFFAGR